jgi:prevent-host-death family protein
MVSGAKGDTSGESVGAFEAKTHLSRLLEEVRGGKIITITRRGVPVAVLAPPGAVGGAQDGHRAGDDGELDARARQAIEAWIAYRDAQPGLGASVAEILEWVNEGRL